MDQEWGPAPPPARRTSLAGTTLIFGQPVTILRLLDPSTSRLQNQGNKARMYKNRGNELKKPLKIKEDRCCRVLKRTLNEQVFEHKMRESSSNSGVAWRNGKKPSPGSLLSPTSTRRRGHLTAYLSPRRKRLLDCVRLLQPSRANWGEWERNAKNRGNELNKLFSISKSRKKRTQNEPNSEHKMRDSEQNSEALPRLQRRTLGPQRAGRRHTKPREQSQNVYEKKEKGILIGCKRTGLCMPNEAKSNPECAGRPHVAQNEPKIAR